MFPRACICCIWILVKTPLQVGVCGKGGHHAKEAKLSSVRASAREPGEQFVCVGDEVGVA